MTTQPETHTYTRSRLYIEDVLNDQRCDPQFDEIISGLTLPEIYDTLTEIYGDLPFNVAQLEYYAAKQGIV